ncbi:MAG TPA: glycoside hydrolase family 44 protein, partial [Caldilineaceae bacterium]|nr:glycoside hydrolase family 44 protein [Caldilineaceae bacterium]
MAHTLLAPKALRFFGLIFLFLFAAGFYRLLPTATHAATGAGGLIVYDDALAAEWEDWSWDTTVDLAATAQVHAGNRAISAQHDVAWAGLSLRAPAVLTGSDYTAIDFWLYGGSRGAALNVYTQPSDEGSASAIKSITGPAGVWTHFTIPLTELGNPATIARLNFQDRTGVAQPAYYLDDLRLIGQTPATATATASPTTANTATPTASPATASTATPTTSPTATPTPIASQPADVHLAVDASADRRPISPDIYGMNTYQMPAPAPAYMQALGVSVRRWGGNATSRYNWKLDVSNTVMDWYFENFKESGGSNLPDDSAVNRFVDQNNQAGVNSFLTLPMIGYTSKDATSCAYSIQKYGPQQGNDWQYRPDCGNGILANGQRVPNPDPADTSLPIDTAWVSEWIAYLTNRYDNAANGGIRFYNLDNEPDIWWETHRDVQPVGWKFQEFRDRSIAYAGAIRAADPASQILGPVVNGWTYYFHGAYDAQRQDWESPDDRNANGGAPFVAWYLQQMAAYDDAHGVRLLDYLDLHYYPQSGVALTGAGNAATQAKRLRSTRSLWDSTYVDESWIAGAGPDGGIVRLIPRMREWVDANYPGTKLAIGEYNWGGLESINGALAQADVLGI